MLTPRPGSRAKERIVGYGPMNSGKTFASTTLADMYRRTNTPGHFHVISTEWQAYDRALELYDDCENVTVVEALDWAEMVDRTVGIANKATSDDWLVFDSIGNAWSFVQDDYCAQRWGTSGKEYFGELRDRGGESEINWSIVNARYQGWMNPNVLRFPGHVYATSPAEELRAPAKSGKESEAKEIRQLYSRYGLKPTGQKRLGFMFHSILLMTSPSKGVYDITTVDDHARQQLDHVEVAGPPFGFVQTYLMDVAHWEIT